jgi:hypothetical protein
MPPDYGRFQGMETGIQPEGCRSDGSSQAIAQAVTDELAVIRPELRQRLNNFSDMPTWGYQCV